MQTKFQPLAVHTKIMSNPEPSGGAKFKFGSSDVSFSTLKDKAGSFSDLLGASNDKELVGNDTSEKAGDNIDTGLQKKPNDLSSSSLDRKSVISGEENECQIFTVCHNFYYI